MPAARKLASTLIAAAALATPATASGMNTSAAAGAIQELNVQRAANGIPPVTLDQSTLKPTCTLQNHWIASTADTWTASVSPWNNAPLHQAALYNPFATGASYAVYSKSESDFGGNEPGGNWTCMWFDVPSTGLGEPVVDTPEFYSFISPDGSAHVPVSESAAEWPTTPNQMVGLPNPTGPNLIVWADLPEVQDPIATSDGTTGWYTIAEYGIQSATLTDASGNSISVKWTTDPGVSEFVLPDKPLSYDTTYHATVVWQYQAETGTIPLGNGLTGTAQPITNSQTFTQTVSFHTASAPLLPPTDANIGVDLPGAGDTEFFATSSNHQVPITVKFIPLNGGRPWTTSTRPGATSALDEIPIPSQVHGRYEVCASQPASGDPHVKRYAAAKQCSHAIVNEPTNAGLPSLTATSAVDPHITLLAHEAHGTLTEHLHWPSYWVGKPFRWQSCPMTMNGHNLGCAAWKHTTITSSMTLTMRLPAKAFDDVMNVFAGTKGQTWMSGGLGWGPNQI